MLYSLRQHLWPVYCQKLWHYSNTCVNNNYLFNKLSTFAFQNISIVIHCNSILNEILFLILHLHIITWKWQEQGPLFQVRRGPKEFLKCHWPQVPFCLRTFWFSKSRALGLPQFTVCLEKQHGVAMLNEMTSEDPGDKYSCFTARYRNVPPRQCITNRSLSLTDQPQERYSTNKANVHVARDRISDPAIRFISQTLTSALLCW
jgi:hypothetical protein